ncbi:MAG TPA: hypothetical protein VGZ25_14840 [Gemmataceae bacterium]|jgi:hypothetical protein|nr:hypothetical protein [Gemmataceae bacterium]
MSSALFSFANRSAILAAAPVVSIIGPLRGQNAAPLDKAIDAVQLKVLHDFEELARAKMISGRLEGVDQKKGAIRVKVDGDKESTRFSLARNVTFRVKIAIDGPDGKPLTKERTTMLSRLKAGQAVTEYLDEGKGKVIRVLVDKSAGGEK